MKSIVYKSLKITKDQYLELTAALKAFAYNSETGEGIQIVEETDNYIYCNYLVEKTRVQDNYNPITKTVDKIEYKKIDFISFIVDHENASLAIMTNQQKAMKIIDMVRKYLRYKVIVNDINVVPADLLTACKEIGLPYMVNRVKLKNYVFFDKIMGECVLNLTNYGQSDEVFKKYDSQILNFTITILFSDLYTITIYKNGAISFNKDVDENDIEFIRLLKKGIMQQEQLQF